MQHTFDQLFQAEQTYQEIVDQFVDLYGDFRRLKALEL